MFKKFVSVILFSLASFSLFALEKNAFTDYAKYRMKGNIPLYFADAQTGKPIKNLEVILEGDEGESDATTNRKGFALFTDLEDGEYILTTNAEGYVSEEFEFEIKAGIPLTWTFLVTKTPESDSLRIVLDWGENPRDLDLHLEQGGGYHISYRDSRTSADGTAFLDVDCVSGWGPETITVEKWTVDKVYSVYVIDYSDRYSVNSNALSQSNATVRVYNSSGLIKSFSVTGGNGNRWDVCTIKNGEVFESGNISELY